MANCNVRVAFAPNRIETAEVLSKMAGQATVRNPTRSYSGSRMGLPMHVVVADQEVARPLLTADEAMRLPLDDAIVFVAGHAPIYGRKIRYYKDKTFSERAMLPAPADRQMIARANPAARPPDTLIGVRRTCGNPQFRSPSDG
jgi:type IV secretion system protein VirD4